MKKLFLATILLIALTTSSIAGGNSALFNDLKSAAKNATLIYRTTKTGDYKEAIFEYNGKTVTALFDGETDHLIGFTVPVSNDELPAGTIENVQKKYKGWEITSKILFTSAQRDADYYLQLNKGKLHIVLSVSRKGKVYFLRSMS